MLLIAGNAVAQKEIYVKYVDSNEFDINGVLDEEMWELAEVSSGFAEYFPTDSKPVEYQTELKMLYSD